MTTGHAPGASYENRGFGAPGADRTVVLLRSGVLASARVEMVPKTDDLAARLILADVWARVLSHVAPGTVR